MAIHQHTTKSKILYLFSGLDTEKHKPRAFFRDESVGVDTEFLKGGVKRECGAKGAYRFRDVLLWDVGHIFGGATLVGGGAIPISFHWFTLGTCSSIGKVLCYTWHKT